MIALSCLAELVAHPPVAEPVDRCELCAGPLPERHGHVVELGVPGVQCACRACAILFSGDGVGARFRNVPERVVSDPAFAMSAERWEALGIPVRLAFFVRDSTRDRVVVSYPGPAGVVEAEIDAAAWESVAAATRLAAELRDDVEALLVRGDRGGAALSCHLVPITTAYELAGRLRRSWRGFSGGEEAERELAAFFAELERRGGRA